MTTNYYKNTIMDVVYIYGDIILRKSLLKLKVSSDFFSV